jgi:hypothetical protein
LLQFIRGSNIGTLPRRIKQEQGRGGISDAGNNRGETLVKGFSGRERDLKTE